VQWMTSGRGIMHEEMPRRGESGLVVGFQLWVNLPAAQKMSPPRYQEIAASAIPAAQKEGAAVRLVAGEYAGVTGPVTEIAAQPLYLDVTLQPEAVFSLPVPAGHTAIAYLFEGEAVFGLDSPADSIQAVHMVVFEDGDAVRVQAAENSSARFMLMAGAPFKEPIVPYGPFVMNTEQEIRQVFAELRNGTFAQS
jgi:quercetin 2,3-dioxygenase